MADPNLMSPVGLRINGRRLRNIFKLVFDLDLSSLYPSILLATNIDIETLLFYIEINRPGMTEIIKDDNNNEHIVPINYAPDFMDAMTSKDWIQFFHVWGNMPDAEEILTKFMARRKS